MDRCLGGRDVHLEQMPLVPGIYFLVSYCLYQNLQLFACHFLWQQNEKCQHGWVSGRDPSVHDAEELQKYPIFLWLEYLTHFLILLPRAPLWHWAPVALRSYLLNNIPFIYYLLVPLCFPTPSTHLGLFLEKRLCTHIFVSLLASGRMQTKTEANWRLYIASSKVK